ncbi:MAG: hypothetical protein ACYC1I_05810 [Acidimicrobiales bacterium]
MAKRPTKSTPKSKKTKGETEAGHFEDVARKLFKVPKTEIAEKGKKP